MYENAGVGVGLPDIGRCNLVVIDGKVHIRTSAACIGQGLGTILTQIICETTGLLPQQIILDLPDTSLHQIQEQLQHQDKQYLLEKLQEWQH